MKSLSQDFKIVNEIIQSYHELGRPLWGMDVWTPEMIQTTLQTSQYEFSRDLSAFIIWQELPDAIEILLLASSATRARQGGMTALFNAWRKGLCEHGLNKETWLEVHQNNHAALSFYLKMGFRVVGKRSKYYKDGGDALLMSRPPDPAPQM